MAAIAAFRSVCRRGFKKPPKSNKIEIEQNGGRTWFRTTGLHRVKVALYP